MKLFFANVSIFRKLLEHTQQPKGAKSQANITFHYSLQSKDNKNHMKIFLWHHIKVRTLERSTGVALDLM